VLGFCNAMVVESFDLWVWVCLAMRMGERGMDSIDVRECLGAYCGVLPRLQ
jgi:hypothetical protein